MSSTAEQHAAVQSARKVKEYIANQRRSIATFMVWYKTVQNTYKVFKRSSGDVWTIIPDKWIAMMDTKPGEGNALFDYVLFSRKKFHLKKEQGMSHFRDVRAALWNLIKDASKQYTVQGTTHLTSFWTGITKQNNAWVQKNGIDDEAKVAVPFYVYEEIAKSMLRQGKIKEWAYLVLQWNLMARKCNVGDIHFNFVRWSADMMTILFCHSKTQKGTRKDVSKFHLSSNSLCPWVCPVTAVALLMMLTNHDGENLFESTAAAASYTRAFDAALEDPRVEAALRKAGVRKEDVASHSIRKSAATFAAGGTTAPPAVFAILLRGGWSLGDVLMRYIKMAEDQDRFLAHVLAGRDVFAESFAMLPPHFTTSPSEMVLKSAFCGEWMQTQYENVKGVLYMLLASAVENIEQLKSEIIEETQETSPGVYTKVQVTHDLIPGNHPIFSNVCLHGATHVELKNLLAQGRGRYESPTMKVTGVPPWSLLSSDVKKMSKKMAEVYKILKELKEAASNGGVPSADATASAILAKLTPILEENETNMKSFINTRLQQSGVALPPPSEGPTANATLASEQFRSIMYQHTGKTLAPPDFSLLGSNNTFFRSFKLFYLGDHHQKVSPLRFMSPMQACQVPTIPKTDPAYKLKAAALRKNYKRNLDAVSAFSAHCQINHETDWNTFCAQPSVMTCNTVFAKGFKTLKRKLTDDLPTTNAGGTTIKRRKKRNWNSMTGPSLLATLGSGSKGYIQSLTNVTVAGTEKKIVVKPTKKGGSLKWNIKMPAASLTLRRVNVTGTTTTFVPLNIAEMAEI